MGLRAVDNSSPVAVSLQLKQWILTLQTSAPSSGQQTWWNDGGVPAYAP